MAEGTGAAGVAIRDLNGDGRAELTVANPGDSNVSVRLGNGDGTFAAATIVQTGAGPKSVAIGDLSGDGRVDIVTANTAASTVGIRFGNGDGTFDTNASPATFSVGISPGFVTLFDLNGDGRNDIVTANSGNNTSRCCSARAAAPSRPR